MGASNVAAATAPETALIAAMLAPALFILASVSLVASALVRMGRVVDRLRVLGTMVNDASWERAGLSRATLLAWIDRHAARARHAERAIALLYGAIVVFVGTCLSIALVRASDSAVTWLPTSLALFGTFLLLAAGALMVAESLLSNHQISEEIAAIRSRLEDADGGG